MFLTFKVNDKPQEMPRAFKSNYKTKPQKNKKSQKLRKKI